MAMDNSHNFLFTFTFVNGETAVYNVQNTPVIVRTKPRYTMHNWVWPKEGANIVILGDEGPVTGHLTATNLDEIQLRHTKRYHTYHD